MDVDTDAKYIVSLQGTEFVLTKSLIEFDSPNYFTACFLGDFQEARTRRIELHRDPDLFRIIIFYLCGYTVLPLNDKCAPPHMSPSTALLNLRADAAFYQLDGLIKACDTQIEMDKPKPPSSAWYLILFGEDTTLVDNLTPGELSHGAIIAFGKLTFVYQLRTCELTIQRSLTGDYISRKEDSLKIHWIT